MSRAAAPIAVDDALARAGVAALCVAITWNLSLDLLTLVSGAPLADMTARHAPLLLLIRAGFLALAGACALALRGALPARFRATAVVAATVLAASIVGDLVGVLATFDVIADPTRALGEVDDVHRRLFRLGAMAARAVPLLALLAALEHARTRAPTPAAPSRAAELVLKLEPWVFLIGAGTLALLLVLSAFVHKEIAWALPIGSDTTLLGCAAAAIRARRRDDARAFAGWLAVSLSMGAGLLMGLYAFGGPLPAPAAIGEYGSLARMVLRDVHVISVAGAIALIAWAAFFPRTTGGNR